MNATRNCSVDGCAKLRSQRRQYCSMHYYRLRRHGSLANPVPSEAERYWAKVEKTDSCWLWTGTDNGRGYGFFPIGGRYVQAHRYAYTIAKGEIPDGLTIDHLCRVRNCVNPDHLEAVTHKENIRRMQDATGTGWVVTHCPVGHEYLPENTYIDPKGSRCCKACRVENTRRWRLKNSR